MLGFDLLPHLRTLCRGIFADAVQSVVVFSAVIGWLVRPQLVSLAVALWLMWTAVGSMM